MPRSKRNGAAAIFPCSQMLGLLWRMQKRRPMRAWRRWQRRCKEEPEIGNRKSNNRNENAGLQTF